MLDLFLLQAKVVWQIQLYCLNLSNMNRIICVNLLIAERKDIYTSTALHGHKVLLGFPVLFGTRDATLAAYRNLLQENDSN